MLIFGPTCGLPPCAEIRGWRLTVTRYRYRSSQAPEIVAFSVGALTLGVDPIGALASVDEIFYQRIEQEAEVARQTPCIDQKGYL